jgi:subfamily B ATP-binding cassette protein MsbA
VLFNLGAILFSLLSIGLVVPVLQLIFGNEPHIPISGDSGIFVELKNSFYREIQNRLQNTTTAAALFYVCIWVVLAFFFKNLFHYLALYFIAPLRNGLTMGIRNALHEKILALPLAYYSKRNKGDIISRMTSDLKEVETSTLQAIVMVFREPLMILGSMGVLLWMNYKLTLFVLVSLPVVSILISQLGKSLKRSSTQAQQLMGKLMSAIDESVGGLRIIKGFNAEVLKHKQFKTLNTENFNTMNRVLRREDLASPLSETLGAAVMASVIWFGGKIVMESDGFGPEQFIAYILFFYQMIAPAKALSRASYTLRKGNAAAERVLEILQADEKIHESEAALHIESFKHSIEFKNVHFSYGERPILQNIHLKLDKGQTLALVGMSGGGKSTLANLIPRFYDLTEGELLIDGLDLRKLKIKSLRNLMGIVSQDPILFNDTVHNNIALSNPNASRAEVEEAARKANAYDFIKALDGGFDTSIGDGGNRLSGGQKQRIAIARAILKNPEILILDEATSALDTESEQLVQEALTRLMQHRTSVIIAHRLSTIRHADKIVVLDQGQIVEIGQHEELLAQQGYYYKLCSMQGLL